MVSRKMLGNCWKGLSLSVGAVALILGLLELHMTLTQGSLGLLDLFAMDAEDPGAFTWWRAMIYVPAGIMLMFVGLGRVDELDGQGRMALASAMIWMIGIMDLFGILIDSVLADEGSGALFISSFETLIENLSPPYPFSLGMMVLTLPIIWMAIDRLRSETRVEVIA